MALYSEKVMDHFRNPRNVGMIENADGVGKGVDQALELTNKAVVEALDGLPPQKIHCSVLAEEAIKLALKDYYDKNGIKYDCSIFPSCDSCDHCHH